MINLNIQYNFRFAIQLLNTLLLGLLMAGIGLYWDKKTFSVKERADGAQEVIVLKKAFVTTTTEASDGQVGPGNSQEQAVHLPHRIRSDVPISAHYAIQLNVDGSALDAPPMALCIPKASAPPKVWLDGVLLHEVAKGPDRFTSWYQQLFLPLPQNLMAGPHRLVVGLATQPATFPGISEIYFGHAMQVKKVCDTLQKINYEAKIGNLYLMVFIGLIALVIGILQRERLSLYLALTSAVWLLPYAINVGWIPDMDQTTAIWLYHCVKPWIGFAWCMFVLNFIQDPHHWLKRCYMVFYAAAYLVFLSLPVQWWNTWLLFIAFGAVLLSVMLLVRMVRATVESFSLTHVLLSSALFFGIFENVWDIARSVGMTDHYGFSMAFLTVPIVALGMVSLVLDRMLGFVRAEKESNTRLTMELGKQRLAIQSDELKIRAQREKLLLQSQRHRWMQDMHDGLGTQLVSASVMLKSTGQQSQRLTELEELIDAALTDMRGMMDVLSVTDLAPEPDDDEVSLLMGMLRHRLSPVMRSQKIQFEWETCDLPHDFLSQDQSRLELMRLLQEAFANIIKHAQASVVHFKISLHNHAITIDIQDNGRGMAAAQIESPGAQGHGLKNMHQRAQKIGATLTIHSTSEGTGIHLSFPRSSSS
jgi:signal transduction histidine kinase